MRNNATNFECTARNTSDETTRACWYCNQHDISFFIRQNEKKETIRGTGAEKNKFFSRGITNGVTEQKKK